MPSLKVCPEVSVAFLSTARKISGHSQIRPRPLPSTFFARHYSLIPPFDAQLIKRSFHGLQQSKGKRNYKWLKNFELLSAAGMMLTSHSPPIATPLEPCRVAPYVNVPSLRLPTAYDRLPFPAFSAFDPALLTAAHQVRQLLARFKSSACQGQVTYLSVTLKVTGHRLQNVQSSLPGPTNRR
jgi:hypothetical protein